MSFFYEAFLNSRKAELKAAENSGILNTLQRLQRAERPEQAVIRGLA